MSFSSGHARNASQRHILTYRYRSIYHPLGALIFINGTYVNTVPLIDAAGVPLTPGISRMHGWEYWQYAPQDSSKGIAELPDTTPQQAALLQSEYERYSQFWTENIQPLYTSVRYVVRLKLVLLSLCHI